MLGSIRNRITPEDSITRIRSIRNVAHAWVLLELLECTDKNKLEAFLRMAVIEIGGAKILAPKGKVEITNLDSLTTFEEVEYATRGTLEEDSSKDLKVSPQLPNHCQLWRAVV